MEVCDPGNVPEAVSVFGFAFYLQPMMMPLLLEMPKGKVGVKLTSWSARIVVLGIYHLTAIGRELLHTSVPLVHPKKHLEIVCRSKVISLR